MISVIVADDQSMVRAGLRSLIHGEEDIQVVAEVGDGQAALEAVRRHQPDVILMDIRMPIMDGLAATRRLVAERSDTRVLVLTTFDLDEYVFEALRAGASGLLLKDATAEDLVAAIRTLAAGDALLDPAVTGRVIEAFAKAPTPSSESRSQLARLTERETEVLLLLGRGLSNLEIAREFTVSETTVKTHVSNVLTKLALRDRVQAVIFTYESGLLTPGDGGEPRTSGS
jgi:DNA-binding NarL/FixJ family response regulator